jgi:hypothetical protein
VRGIVLLSPFFSCGAKGIDVLVVSSPGGEVMFGVQGVGAAEFAV